MSRRVTSRRPLPGFCAFVGGAARLRRDETSRLGRRQRRVGPECQAPIASEPYFALQIRAAARDSITDDFDYLRDCICGGSVCVRCSLLRELHSGLLRRAEPSRRGRGTARRVDERRAPRFPLLSLLSQFRSADCAEVRCGASRKHAMASSGLCPSLRRTQAVQRRGAERCLDLCSLSALRSARLSSDVSL